MDGVLNDRTSTVHRRANGRGRFDAECGALRHVGAQALEPVAVGQAVEGEDVDRCGRCFEHGGGY